jgi:hypothetical protein
MNGFSLPLQTARAHVMPKGESRRELAPRPSLQQCHSDQRMIERQLLNTAQTKTENMNFKCVTELEFKEEETFLFKMNSTPNPWELMLFCQ